MKIMAAANSGSVGRGKLAKTDDDSEVEQTIVDLVASTPFVISKSQARRLVAQGAVKLDDTVIVDWNYVIRPGHTSLSVGKETVTFRTDGEDNGAHNN
jgi:tyrosyl-tRNA synthetase